MKSTRTAVWLEAPVNAAVGDAIEKAARSHPEWPDVQNRLGLLLAARGRLDEALGVFDRTLEIHPRYAWASLNLAATLALQSRFREAKDVLQAVGDPAPGSRAVSEGWVAVLEGRGEVEASILNRLRRERRDRPDVLWLVAALRETSDSKTAAASWQRVVESPDLAPGYTEVDRLRTPRSPRAIRSGLFPGFHELWIAAGEILIRCGQRDAAESALRTAYLYWSERGRHLLHRGRLAELAGEPCRAADFYTLAMDAAPDDPAAPAALAAVCAKKGDLERAAALLRMALERGPGYADLHRRLGTIESARGNLENALAAFQRALEVNPLFAAARLDAAHVLFRMGRWADALDAFERSASAGLRSPDMLVQLGRCREELGMAAEAEATYREVIAMNPKEAGAFYRLGILYRNLGRREAAKEAWRHYLALTESAGDLPERDSRVTSQLRGSRPWRGEEAS